MSRTYSTCFDIARLWCSEHHNAGSKLFIEGGPYSKALPNLFRLVPMVNERVLFHHYCALVIVFVMGKPGLYISFNTSISEK